MEGRFCTQGYYMIEGWVQKPMFGGESAPIPNGGGSVSDPLLPYMGSSVTERPESVTGRRIR